MQMENAKEILLDFEFIWVRLTIIKTSSKYWSGVVFYWFLSLILILHHFNL